MKAVRSLAGHLEQRHLAAAFSCATWVASDLARRSARAEIRHFGYRNLQNPDRRAIRLELEFILFPLSLVAIQETLDTAGPRNSRSACTYGRRLDRRNPEPPTLGLCLDFKSIRSIDSSY